MAFEAIAVLGLLILAPGGIYHQILRRRRMRGECRNERGADEAA
jgi:hypothetical protein